MFRQLDHGGDGTRFSFTALPTCFSIAPGSLDMARAAAMFPNEADPNAKAKEARSWLATKGVREFEPVSLFCDQLKKVTPLRTRLSLNAHA